MKNNCTGKKINTENLKKKYIKKGTEFVKQKKKKIM